MIPVGEGSSCAGPSSVKKSKRFEIKKSGMSWLSGLGILLWITVLYAAMFSKAKLRRARGALRCEATGNCLGAVRLGVLHCTVSGKACSNAVEAALFCRGDATHARSFTMNALSGEIPKELGKLSDLRSLAFSTNNFSGPLPPELGNLTNLEHMNCWKIVLQRQCALQFRAEETKESLCLVGADWFVLDGYAR